MRFPIAVFLAASLGMALAASAKEGSPVDWEVVAAPQVVEILTTDAEGEPQRTKIWIVLVDGRAYIRTLGTSWHANLERDPEARIVSQEREYAVRVVHVEDEELRGRIEAAFREKYGLSDRLRGLVLFGRPNIMRLESR